jgi:hypothetical protein
MGAELLRRAADELDLTGYQIGPTEIIDKVSGLLRAYADQERHTEAEDSPVDAAIHDLATEILR